MVGIRFVLPFNLTTAGSVDRVRASRMNITHLIRALSVRTHRAPRLGLARLLVKLALAIGVGAGGIWGWSGCSRGEAAQAPEKSVFRLSSSTKEIIAGLDGPVEIRYYVSAVILKERGFAGDYAEVVGDVLEQYRLAGKGRITVTRISPRTDTDTEDAAQRDGIEAMSMPETKPRYFGLCVVQGDNKATIPYLAPERERLLEYEITRCLWRVSSTKKPVLGVLSTLPVWGGATGSRSWLIVSELQRDYELRKILPEAESIPGDIDILVVHHPRELKPALVQAIDRFIVRGGRALIFLDPLAMSEAAKGQIAPSKPASGLEPLLKAWGISFTANQVVVDGSFTKPVSQQGGGSRLAPGLLFLEQGGKATNDLITTGIDMVLLGYSGVFAGKPVAGLRQTVLLHTSDNSQLVDPITAQLGGEKALNELKPTSVRYPVAIRLVGQFPSAYTNDAPAGATTSQGATVRDGASAAAAPGRDGRESIVILVGDADCLADALCVREVNLGGQKIVQPISGNLRFVQNAVEQLDCGLTFPALPSLVAEKRRQRFAAKGPIRLPQPARWMSSHGRSRT